ncbi:poly(3-hydroxyalkanoate) synthetase [Paraburkholderia bryophila]|uniref:Poly(3-hydroxyalkanoate) synthetase n=1 Tax=Paraburkholderia bryophila TaxID=420952 RepID=A0A7Y9WHR5_9BURK|nr:poly(3-hydroxyalkanoate) synthetase [Paraburkholderia bryophila]
MPYRMHSEYLPRLFLDNDLACGRYLIDERPVSVRNIRAPMLLVGTERDHIAPWRSVYKIHNLSDTDITFVLASGGHNADVVSEPGHPHRHFRLRHSAADDRRIGPDQWLTQAPPLDGSWWPAWLDWLAGHSSARRIAPPAFQAGGEDLPDAPGTYVYQH